jgi:hypothetical protein
MFKNPLRLRATLAIFKNPLRLRATLAIFKNPLRLRATLAIFALLAAPHRDFEAVLRTFLYARRRKIQAATCCSFLGYLCAERLQQNRTI